MKHNRRHSVLLYNILRLLLVLALLQVPGVGRAQETSVETIFTHPEYQYQLRLKPGWKVTANVDPEKPGQALIEIPSFPSERLELMVVPNQWNVTALEWVEYLAQIVPYPTEIINRMLIVDGLPTVVQKWQTDEPEATGISYIVDAGDYFLLLVVQPNTLYQAPEIQYLLSRLSLQGLRQKRLTVGEKLSTGLLQPSSPDSISATDWKLPWQGGNKYYFTGGPHLGYSSARNGLDFAPGSGASWDVQTIEDSRVVYTGPDSTGFGTVVKVDHGGGWQSWYAHLASINTSTNWCIAQGSKIGVVGKSGGNYPNHIHLDLWRNGVPVSWHGKEIDGWKVYENCSASNAPKGCLSSNYNGYIEKGGRQVLPEDNPGPAQLIESGNPSIQACIICPTLRNHRGELIEPQVEPGAILCAPPTPTPPCPAPSLQSADITDRTIAFKWNDVNCSHNGFTFRVKTTTNMDSGGETVIDTGEGGTSRTVTFDSRWDDKDLYWSVRAANAPGGASWAPARHFRISPNKPPTIDFNTANGNGDSRITTREQNWSFQGTAGDPENRFSRVEFRCNDCDNRGSGQDNSTSTNWSITRNWMSGRNYVYFEAFDDKQGKKSDKTLELNIDLAAPTTIGLITGNMPPSGWFIEPAQVSLNAHDNGTGRAKAEVKEIRYRRDGGGEQVQPGATVNFSEGGDGEHTVRFYAVDSVGNVESENSATYRVDRTPPTAIGGVRETHAIANDTWQKTQKTPTFAWNASSDATSGLSSYQLYFGEDANGTAVHKDVAAGASLEWTPNNLGVVTGVYYLRGRALDKAGNASPWQTLFTFKYDGMPPPNPGEATHLDGPKNDTWQTITARPNFTWTPPVDEGSGVKGYFVYWGNDEKGESTSFITANSLQSATPLCGAGAACTGYLRLQSQDNVDQKAEKFSTTFVLRYDGAPPVAAFTVNNGVTQTAQTLIQLNLQATDAGSGLREMRFSNDGQGWSAWEAYAASRVWEIPAISRQFWPIYAQVKDAVGNESLVVSRTVYLDVNVDRPRSANFRLFDWADVAGAGGHTSASYKAHASIGQVMDSPRITSTSYLLVGGYEAGSRAIPLVDPGHDEFDFINGIFASGVVNDTLKSAHYRLIGTAGETALPNNRAEIASVSYRHQPGFLAAHPSPAETGMPTPTPTPGPTPTPTPTPDCEFPRVSINDGAVFTTGTAVTLNLCAPNVTQMQVSNDGGFGGVPWETYARSKPWTLTSHSNYVIPRYVYVAYKDSAGQIFSTYLDDIILDPNPPEAKVQVGTNLPLDENLLAAARAGRESAVGFQTQGAVLILSTGLSYLSLLNGQPLAEPIPLLSASAAGGVDLYLSARDAVGNVTQMQVSDTGSFGGVWENYNALKEYTPSGGDGMKTIYARFQDEAGNISQAYTGTFALDTLPPLGGIALSHPILGPDVVTTTVWLGAQDNLSGLAAMRLSTDPTFADAIWRPFASTLTWVYSQADRSRSALHVQFRDAAGNVSEVYAAPLLVDNTPPLVYVEVEAGQSFTRTVHVYSYDELTYPSRMRITNDPLFSAGVMTQPYADTLTWNFDARRVVWVQVQDGVGNWSEPYPAYAEQAYFDIAGDCNNDGKTDAGDISALSLEIFDQDGNTPNGVVNGSFAGNPLGCDANRDALVDAGDISCAVLLIFNGPGACSVQSSVQNNPSANGAGSPRLTIPLGIPATPGQPVTVPVSYASNGNSISSLVFSLDYDQSLLAFDAADSDADGIADGVVVTAPAGFQASVGYDGSDTVGELDVLIADVFPPLAALPDGALISVTLGVTPTVNTPLESPLPFAQEPQPSFGATNGSSVPGAVQDGSVLVGGNVYPLYLPVVRR